MAERKLKWHADVGYACTCFGSRDNHYCIGVTYKTYRDYSSRRQLRSISWTKYKTYLFGNDNKCSYTCFICNICHRTYSFCSISFRANCCKPCRKGEIKSYSCGTSWHSTYFRSRFGGFSCISGTLSCRGYHRAFRSTIYAVSAY